MDKMFRLDFFSLVSHENKKKLLFTEICKVTYPADAKGKFKPPPPSPSALNWISFLHPLCLLSIERFSAYCVKEMKWYIIKKFKNQKRLGIPGRVTCMSIPLERLATQAETLRFVYFLSIHRPADAQPGSLAMNSLRDLLLFCYIFQVNIFNTSIYTWKKPETRI